MKTISETVGALNLGDVIAEKCFEIYESLGKSGKPRSGEEWTLLAGIVVELNDEFKVVSLATGTKCIGRTAMSPYGDVLNDSHAEVLARRSFLRYLYNQMEETSKNGHSFFFSHLDEERKLYHPRANIKLHFYTSHVPCGDASIIPMTSEDSNRKRKSEETEEGNVKKSRPEETEDSVGRIVDVHRTGAKVVEGSQEKDKKLGGVEYHVTGPVRTKPGRGHPTLSVSCSDKIARWIFTGIQGALLSQLLDSPLLLDSLTIGGGGQFSLDSLERALVSRSSLESKPNILRSKLIFKHSKYESGHTARPCPSSIIWSDVPGKKLEIAVDGKRQGCTKKNKDKCRLMVCKRELFRVFLSVHGPSDLNYADIKKLATNYRETSNIFKEKMGSWTRKDPSLFLFSV